MTSNNSTSILSISTSKQRDPLPPLPEDSSKKQIEYEIPDSPGFLADSPTLPTSGSSPFRSLRPRPLNILVVGGTGFYGRHIVEYAHKRGHSITLLNRGERLANHPEDFSFYGQVDLLRGDRSADLPALVEGRFWDVVVDTCAYTPRTTRIAVEALKDKVGLYVYVSTTSVYRDPAKVGLTEESEVLTPVDPEAEDISSDTYGSLKVLCERLVQDLMPPERVLIMRPGMIVGPYDHTDRFTYWPRRMQRGGQVLLPGGANRLRPVQFVDVRDLSEFTVHLIEQQQNGVFHVAGPADRLTWEEFAEQTRDAVNPDAELVWVDDTFLNQRGVTHWMDLSLWLAEGKAGLACLDIGKALMHGMKYRKLAETVRDILAWDRSRGSVELKLGLKREREEELLEEWRAHCSEQN